MERIDPLILVVDDSKDANLVLTETLELSGFRVSVARDGEEALWKARYLSPAVVLLDLAMPGMDGFDVARRMKGDPATRGVPILAVSGYRLPDWEARAVEAGCQAFLQKPVHPDDLVSAVRRALGSTPAG